MSDLFDRSGRSQPPRRQSPRQRNVQSVPTLEDYHSLYRAHASLQEQYKEQALEIQRLQRLGKEQADQLKIKSDAIAQQTADIKKLDAEILWLKTALDEAAQQLASQQTEQSQPDGEWQERFARLQAEMDNVRKRWEQRAATEVREERNRILLDMLPLADHLELALQHAENHVVEEQPALVTAGDGQDAVAQPANTANQSFIDNMKATLNAFLHTLKRYDVTPIAAAGQPFDPNLHEAVGRDANSDLPHDHVVHVLQTGYMDGEKLLRPARVLLSGV
ncbi:MAG: nucleotide exchange factor GrpE [Caldilineaceae bacterium]